MGTIALMGSGELTATMVEVHKELLGRLAAAPTAVFLDTPAGFQLNADQISEKARDYFQSHIQQTLEIASFKSNETISPFEAEQAYQTLRDADFVLIGPGSPTYAVQQWRQSAIPQILTGRIREGGCLVAASAAALTVGRFTLPVYEIYKVGRALHWVVTPETADRRTTCRKTKAANALAKAATASAQNAKPRFRTNGACPASRSAARNAGPRCCAKARNTMPCG